MSARPPVTSKRKRFTSIPGFSDQPGLPRLGKIRLGVKKTTDRGKEYPTEVDYFVFDPDGAIEPLQRTAMINKFHETYGERPQVIPHIRFIAADREEAFSQSLEWWGKGKRLCHGNGDEAERLVKVDETYSEWQPWGDCANSGCPQWAKGDCSMTTRLRFLLPDISVAGYFQIDTGSKWSSANLRNCLNLLEALFGRINGIPLTLARVPQKIEHEGKAQTHYILHLRAPNVTMDEMKELTSRSQFMLPSAEDQFLEPPDEDMPEDIIPASVQVAPEPVDLVLAERIATAFGVMGINEATEKMLRAQYPRQADLIAELERRWKAKNEGERRQA